MKLDDPRYEAILKNKKTAKAADKVMELKRRKLTEAEAYKSLLEHFGWKLLFENFIKPKLSVERFLTTDPKDLVYEQQKALVLREMLTYIKSRVDAAVIDQRLLDYIEQLNPKEEGE